VKVFGPDGRAWTIARQPQTSSLLAWVSPKADWMVEARAEDDERRRWHAAGRRAATALTEQVGLALRTGAEGPAGELPPEGRDADSSPERPDQG
jgi:hypothetical protein